VKKAMTRNDADEQIAAGLETLRLLGEQGCDLARARLVTHSFTGHEDQLEMLGASLKGTGYTVEPDGERGLTASTLSVIDDGWLRESMAILCRVADYFSVDYLGFEALADTTTH